ncbi:penicillin acylase family protein [Candidatus Symbiobacter mobilis]|uniref:Penicillin amidase n=1 Tax=Candidatus Symbiobacter mobilis CR TaxID=946483 RepID=U5N5B3_9BURK|nr:penicillin acylase family protein [Candidatus Symbiobacter mobilis]AGX86445.1 penicillin amidase [Candidatus Symbiobacter mobilis CR]
MKLLLHVFLAVLVSAIVAVVVAVYAYLGGKMPQRAGHQTLPGLLKPVEIRYDERGIPHIHAENQADLYRALGYVHAQDRLFQMEMARRLARGELSEILGPTWIRTDRLYRTLGLRENAEQVVAGLDRQHPAVLAQLAYLDGVNQFQSSHPAPMEFDWLGIPKREFTLVDTMAVWGSLAFAHAVSFQTAPVLTYIRDNLGAAYLQVFDLEWNPMGVLRKPEPEDASAARWTAWSQLAGMARETQEKLGWFEGSNGWVIAGERTESGAPLLAGDPHMGYALPSQWYEAHLSAPGFELHGHFHALMAHALLGHNSHFAWTLTMFQNDDMDLIREAIHPENPDQVWFRDGWVDMPVREEVIVVKGANPVTVDVQRSPHGPLVTSALPGQAPENTALSMWWTYWEAENQLLHAYHELNRADTLAKARAAASKIHAPGVHILWANADGDIGWWAAARLPIRPLEVQPAFVLDGTDGSAEKLGFYRFEDNPQEENPPRGYILSANQQPTSVSGVPIPGYYSPPDRARVLDDKLLDESLAWNLVKTQELQMGTQSVYPLRVLHPLLEELYEVVQDPLERSVLDSLSQWNGDYSTLNIPPTVYSQFTFELVRAAMADELGPEMFALLRQTRALDHALPKLAEDAESPWWDDHRTPETETRADIIAKAWRASSAHLRKVLGKSPNGWGWGMAHTITFAHPLADIVPMGRWLNVGPFSAPGGREVPNQMATPIGPAPWKVSIGPSTRRVVDFGERTRAVDLLSVGQSGVWSDRHYADQAAAFVVGGYMPQYVEDRDVLTNTRSILLLYPRVAAPVASAGH